MGLSTELISQFAKMANADKKQTPTETTVNGTVVYDGRNYVKIDGSDLLTPVETTSVVKDGDRVTVLIKNHTATITGNISDPSASSDTVEKQSSKIQEFEIVIADKVSVDELEAEKGRIDDLVSDNVLIRESLTATNASIKNLESDNVTINEKLTAAEADIKKLDAEKINAEFVDANYAKIEDLEATNADIYNLNATYANFESTTTKKLEAIDADIKNLDAEKLSAEEADIKYATIEKLDATIADVKLLDADVADINTLIFDSASGNTISTNFANAVIAQLGDAQIKSAMIESIAAGKITAGDIITNNVRVMSEDGSLIISDETIQISDENRVRVQIGKDASNDYSINIWDADGNLMFSEGGITDSAIKDAIIRNDMVSENANIAASKLDISSLFTAINEDGSNTLNSSKILMDADNQTLDVAFKNMTTKVETVEGAANLAQATANKNAEDMATIVTNFNSDINNLQDQIDGSITTWFYEVPPNAENEPESRWTTTTMKNNHLGDLYYDTVTGYCYRYQVQNNAYSWQRISDTDITKALAEAQAAQDTADQKRRVFYTQPEPPYDKGDLWVQGEDGDILRCQTTKAVNQSFAEADWVLASKYTDDTAADAAMDKANETAGELVTVKETVSTQGTDISVIQGQINSKIWEQDITEAVTTLDGEITEKTSELTTKYSELDQKVDGISSTVSEHTTLINEKADSSTVTEVSTKVSNLEQDVSGFKQTVSETYATKDTLKDYSTTSQMNSAIEQSAKGITQTVSETYATKDTLKDYSTTSQMNSAIEQSAKGITQTVSDLQTTLEENYSTTEQMTSAIDQSAKGITSKVSSLEEVINTKNQTFEGEGDPNYTGSTVGPLFTNLVDSATYNPGDGDIYKGVGYCDNRRWSSSGGTVVEYTNARATGWMPYTPGTRYYIKNMGISYVPTNSGYVAGLYFVYSTDGVISTTTISYSGSNIAIVDQDNDLVIITPEYDCDYFLISGYCVDANLEPIDPPIITCNEEIAYGEVGATGNPYSPSVTWKEEGTEADHVGDLYVDTETGYLYRWELNDDIYAWERVKDGDITQAQNTADSADSKTSNLDAKVNTMSSEIEQLANSIKFLVTDENGETMMVQTSTGWTFNMSEVTGQYKEISDGLDAVKGELGSTDAVVDALKTEFADVQTRTKYVDIGEYVDPETKESEPCIELGKIVNEDDETNTVFKVIITNKRIMFMEDTMVHTYIDTNGLVTDNITINEDLIQKNDNVSGSFIWRVRANGNYGLMWKEGE